MYDPGNRVRFDPNPPPKREAVPKQTQKGDRGVSVVFNKPLVATSVDKYQTIGRRELNTYQNREQMRRL